MTNFLDFLSKAIEEKNYKEKEEKKSIKEEVKIIGESKTEKKINNIDSIIRAAEILEGVKPIAQENFQNISFESGENKIENDTILQAIKLL